MRVAQYLATALVLLAMATTSGWGQVAAAASAPASGNAACPSFGSNTPSASEAHCATRSQSSDLLDGGRHLFLTLGALGGYDSAFDSKEGLTASFGGGLLYTGMITRKPKSFNLIENTASLTNYHTQQSTLQYVDSVLVSLSKVLSSQSVLTFDVNNMFGNDALRILQFGGASSNEVASYGIHAGRVLDNQATLRYTHQSTERRWWSASIRNNLRNLIDDHQTVNTAHGRVEFRYQPSPQAAIGVYEETAIQTGPVNCAAQSAGLVYERRVGRWVAFEAAGGPALASKGCVTRLSADLYGAISFQPSRSTNLSASAFRKLNDSQFTAMTFENSAQGGLEQRFGTATWFKAQAGWMGGTMPSHVTPFRALYFTSLFGHTLPGGFSASFSAQHFQWEGVSNVAPTRVIFSGTVYWSPNRGDSDQSYGPAAH